jgi:UDP-glucose 4-epimerase
MKILVIGGCGFIGSNVVNFFSQVGDEITVTDINKSSSLDAPFIQLDRDNPDFNSLFKNDNYDVCINASGSADVSYSLKYPERDFELNVRNVEKILSAIQKYNPTCRLINFSSAAVYGNVNILPIKESSPTVPVSPYGKHKLKSEKILEKYCNDFFLNTCSLRIFSAYGQGLKKQLFWDIYQKAKKVINDGGSILELYGTGKESRDFIFIDDLVDAIAAVIKKGSFNGEVINVASGIETTIEDAAIFFTKLIDEKLKVTFNGIEKPGDPLNWRADISILQSFGFAPLTLIERGIQKYYEWLKTNPQL